MSEATSTVGEAGRDVTGVQATVEANVLRSALEPVLALFDECHLQIDEAGIRLTGIDPATVACVEVDLGRAAFEAFDATEVHVGIDAARFGDVVGMADSGGTVRLALDSETRRLHIRIGGLAYDLALLDPDVLRSPPEGIGNFDGTARAVAEGADVARSIRAAGMVADHAELAVEPDPAAFAVSAEGDTDDVSLELPDEDLLELDPGEARSLFSIDYLEPIARAAPRDAAFELRLGVEQPLSIRYDIVDGEGAVEFLVAPRIATN
ncbi:DNA polymerase sliding clamp [Natronobeatus ordinarius]|uniref:DNA polymerase sliding clamp n=1 Tax=Natronobeatus ordinarius TaxID=2963433 RepID=UPI0020CDC335|nr:DNA polymerase sliding clamp [Natronobeatus ordinarius]